MLFCIINCSTRSKEPNSYGSKWIGWSICQTETYSGNKWKSETENKEDQNLFESKLEWVIHNVIIIVLQCCLGCSRYCFNADWNLNFIPKLNATEMGFLGTGSAILHFLIVWSTSLLCVVTVVGWHERHLACQVLVCRCWWGDYSFAHLKSFHCHHHHHLLCSKPENGLTFCHLLSQVVMEIGC